MGDIVYVRYFDHVLFRDSNASSYEPFVRETVGWLDYSCDDYIRLVWERSAGPEPKEKKATGLVILKSCIMEIRKKGICENMHEIYVTGNNRDPPKEKNARTVEGHRQKGRDPRPSNQPGAR